MDWYTTVFVWLNVIGVIALVLWREGKRVNAATAAADGLRDLVQLYAQSAESAAVTAQQAIQQVAASHQASLQKLSEDYRLLLQHDGAMASGGINRVLSALERSVKEHGHLMFKLLSVHLISEQSAAGRVAGNGNIKDVLDGLNGIAASKLELGTEDQQPPRESESPLMQG